MEGKGPPHLIGARSYEIEDGCFIQDGQRLILADQSDRSDRLCGHNIDRTTIEWRPLLSEVSRGSPATLTQRLRHASGTWHRSQNHRAFWRLPRSHAFRSCSTILFFLFLGPSGCFSCILLFQHNLAIHASPKSVVNPFLSPLKPRDQSLAMV